MAKKNNPKQTPKTKSISLEAKSIKLGKNQKFAAELAPRTKPPKKTGDKK